MKGYILLLSLILLFQLSFSQNKNLIDSLLSMNDTLKAEEKVDNYNTLCWNLRNSNPEEAILYGQQAIDLAKEIEYHLGLVKAHSFLGVSYRNLGNYTEAFDYYFKGLEFAIKYDLIEQQGYAYNNLGNLYIYQEYFDDAVKNLTEAYKIAEQIDNKKMLAYSSLNLGRSYLMKYDFEKALEYLNKAEEIRYKLEDYADQAVCIKYIGDVYNEQQLFEEAFEQYKKALSLTDFDDDKDLLSDTYNKIALLYYKKGNFQFADDYAQKSLEIAFEVGSKLRIKEAYSSLSKIYIELKDYEKATEYQSLVIEYNDSLFNQKLSEKILTIEYSLEQQRKQAEIDLLNKDKEIQDLQLTKQKSMIWSLLSVLLLSLLLVSLLFISNKQRKKANYILNNQKNEIIEKNIELKNQNEEIKAQRDEIEVQKEYIEKHRDEILIQKKQIVDSLHYARRIQAAVMQDNELLETFFRDIFVMLKPRDIVSGDFYWFYKYQDNFLLAVADCTGHGVPGAFMSILGVYSLKEVVINENITKPSEVLNLLRNKIKSSLKQTLGGNDPKDGMDMSLCNFNLEENRMEYSGANSPIVLIRDNQIIQYKPNRNPIGIYLNEKEFTNNEIILQPNDMIYMFSDGYSSQFGGIDGMKFKTTNFRELLLEISEKDLRTQHKFLENKLSEWKGNIQQVDDILIIGVKI